MKWKRQRFDQLADFRNGLNFGADQRGGELAVLGVGDFGQSVLRSSDSLETVSVSNGSSGVSELAEGDLVFVRSNGSRDLVGRCMYVERVTRRTSHSGFTIRARATSDDLNPKWAATFFQSGMADRAMGRGSPGTNISNITQGILGGVMLPIPPKAVQDHLVRVLDGVDHRKDKLEALLKAKRAFKRALTNDLLTGRRRFPEFADQPWVTVPLGDIVRAIEAGVSVRSHARPTTDGEIGVLKTSALSGGRFNPAENKVVRSEDASRARMSPRRGCTLVSRMNTIALVGESAFVETDRPGLYLPDRLWQVEPIEDVDPEWFAVLLGSPIVRSRLRLLASGTSGSMKNISQPQLKSIHVRLPSRSVQERTAGLRRALDTELTLLEQTVSRLKQLKRGLMQRLLSGEIEIPEHLAAAVSTTGGTNDDS